MFRTLVPAGLLLLALLVVVGCGARQSERTPRDPDAAGSAGENGAGGTASAGGLGDPTLGAPDAPVVMVEWGDFR